MSEQITYAKGTRVGRSFGILEVPCIRGESVSRHPGRLSCDIHDGRLVGANGEPLQISDLDHQIRGWGELDGPGYDVTNGAWHVSVPAATIQQLVDEYGLVMP